MASDKVRFAVVGLGHFAQAEGLPAFAETKHCELVALFSGDATKLAELKDKYSVEHALPYAELDGFLGKGLVDAVYIVLPNDMHCDYTLKAATAGVHVLCEKPMAVTSAECEKMIAACDSAKVKLMIAYRLHLEEGNLSAVELLKGKTLGEPRYFVSGFSQQVAEGIRTRAEKGGGPIYDIGIYCINAVRYLFQAEPVEVMAFRESKAGDDRFREVDEQMSVLMRFPDERLATFTCGFGASKESFYDVVCTEGRLRLDPAYDHSRGLSLQVTPAHGETETRDYPKRGQVAAELDYFAECIANNEEPEPSGLEGLADVRVIEAIHESAKRKGPVAVKRVNKTDRPSIEQERERGAHDKPNTVNVQPPSR